jgi:transposase
MAPNCREPGFREDLLAATQWTRIRRNNQRTCLYSPNLNPIEEAFSEAKRLLRVIGARAKEALVEAIGKALDAVGASDARGFFTHCGYDGLKQQLQKTL